MKWEYNSFLAGVILILIIGTVSCNNEGPEAKPNVLFIAVDDLRPELNCYGETQIISPNIDQLAAEGLVFKRAYCNVPVCGASRASLLTGTRPTRARFKSYNTWIDKDNPDVPTLPEYFRQNGYYTIGNSKVAHHEGDGNGSWDEEWRPMVNEQMYGDYKSPENQEIEKKYGRGPAFESSNLTDTAYFDGKTAEKAISDLRRLHKMDKPFFLGVGFLKPHLPFNAPQKYFDLYSIKDIELPGNNFRSEGVPDLAFENNSGELRKYYNMPNEGPFCETDAKNLIQGYYACVSYVDAQIGKVLDELKNLGLEKNTIVILWGDHGWSLSEHSLWGKQTNFETSLRTPLIIKVPGYTGNAQNQSVVELLDIYPTLCELCGLELPRHLEGRSMVGLLQNPSEIWDECAVAKWKNGMTFIQNNYFYTEWSKTSDSIVTTMLYDHSLDPNEIKNIADREENKDLVKKLSGSLHQSWGADFDLNL